jgi:hypothetical protein
LINDAERGDRKFLDVSRWRLPSMSERHQGIGIGALVPFTAGLVASSHLRRFPRRLLLAAVSSKQSPQVVDDAGPEQRKLTDGLAAAVAAWEWPAL